jgi:hypothetical protein
MAELMERVKLSLLYNGNGIPDNFKIILCSSMISIKVCKDVESINTKDIYPGGFYFLHYKDDSNWLKYAPVFMVDFKKFEDKIILLAVNFNFVPIEIRVMLFDKFISKDDFEKITL